MTVGRGAIAIAAMLLLAPAPGSAQTRVIRFGVTGDYPPFAERQGDGTLTGADIVIARHVARAMKARADFIPTSWSTLAEDFAAGRFDVAIGGLTVTPDRAALGVFSTPLLDDGKRPLVRCGEQDRYRTLAAIDRPGVRVQINRGPAIGMLAKAWFRRATITVNPDDATLAESVARGDVDVWITDGVVVDHMARRYRGRLCAATRSPFTHLTKAWLIRRDARLVATINTVLGQALRTGAWRRALKAVR